MSVIRSTPIVSRQRLWQLRFPDRRKAHNFVSAALAAGRLHKPSGCEQCGAIGGLDGHHADYSAPLTVQWLCRSCHCRRHPRKLVKTGAKPI